MRRFFSWAFVSIFVVISFWSMQMFFHETSARFIFCELFQLLRKIGILPIVFSIVLLFLSFFARALRYKVIAAGMNEKVSLAAALQAVILGRAYTLITPTALFGGQPVSYFVLTNSGVTWNTSGSIIFITTFFDFIFFVCFAPFLYRFVSTATDIHAAFFQFSLLTLILGGIFLLAVLFLFLPGGYFLIRLLDHLTSKVKFLSACETEVNLHCWVQQTRKSISAFFRHPLYCLQMAGLTVLGFCPVYIGIFILLRGADFSVDAYNCVIRQAIVNSTSLFFSPGGGSVTGELGFISLFSQFSPDENMLPASLLFSAYSYWLSIFVGLSVAILLLKKTKFARIRLTLTKNFLAEYPGIQKLRLSYDDKEQIIPVNDLANTNIKVPFKKTIHLQAIDSDGETDLFDFESLKEYICLEVGKKDTPFYDRDLPARLILKSTLCKAAVKIMFPLFRKRVLQGKDLFSPGTARFLHIEQRACNSETSRSLIPLMQFWDSCSSNEKRLIKGAVSAYAESRILRSYFKEKAGFWIPALLSLQVTDSCNLKCLGCEVSIREKIDPEARYRVLRKYLSDFHALGGRHVLLLGGEPLLLGDRLFDLLKEFNDTYFVLFSNATLFKEKYCSILSAYANTVPIFSIDGTPEETARRREKHVFASVVKAQDMLKKYGLINGVSIMLHDGNHQMLRENNFFKEGFGLKHRFVMFVTYTNPRGCDKVKALDLEKQMNFYMDICRERRKGYPFYFLPQDEMFVHGGCGGMRGIFHINGVDALTPCPFAFDSQLESGISGKNLKEVLKKHNSTSLYPCNANGECSANFVTIQKLHQALEKNG